MANNNPKPSGEKQPRSFFTLGEHMLGSHLYRFQYDGRTYRILEKIGDEGEETETLTETDSRKAYDEWNRIKRPERFSGKASKKAKPDNGSIPD